LPAKSIPVPKLLDLLEAHYGPQQPNFPDDPYLFLVWWHSGYPQSDANCSNGWAALKREIGTDLRQVLATPAPQLAHALKAGGMVPELRALRLKEIAARIQDELGGDLRSALVGPVAEARKLLKKFPNIADPGADRILLFGGVAPLAAVPSNVPQVLVRIRRGQEHENYGATYKEAQQEIEAGVPAKFDARTRAYLLLKRHGQEICKRTKPKCDVCPISSVCAYFAGHHRGRSTSA
jgi:endonuclease III